MRAMVLERRDRSSRATASSRVTCRCPSPGPGQVLIRVTANGVCRTDLHVVEGELTEPKLPLMPGHQIVGVVERAGPAVPRTFAPGARVGVPWLGAPAVIVAFCASGSENLCDEARFTGYQLDGGYAEYAVADARFTFALPDGYGDVEVAPLLCAGLIGYRSLRIADPPGPRPAGAARHLRLRRRGPHRHPGRDRPRRRGVRLHARRCRPARSPGTRCCLGRFGARTAPPGQISTPRSSSRPAGELVPAALRAVRKGGTVVTGGIHMSEIPALPYEILWGERVLRSVANLTREDAEQFLATRTARCRSRSKRRSTRLRGATTRWPT